MDSGKQEAECSETMITSEYTRSLFSNSLNIHARPRTASATTCVPSAHPITTLVTYTHDTEKPSNTTSREQSCPPYAQKHHRAEPSSSTNCNSDGPTIKS
eukprot:scaffold1887_cov267-Chaetoceros_neogracile.AAC.7